MQDSGAPTKIPLPFGTGAGSGFINSIPTPSQIGIANGRASFTDGFVPLNFQPVAAGGVPPFGGDFNGLLLQATGGLQWLQAGGPIFYDPTFSAAIGGYPSGAVVHSAAYAGVWWTSTADNNTSNPDTGGAGWTYLSSVRGYQAYNTAGTYSFTVVSPNLKVRAWAAGGGSGASSGAGSGSTGGGGGEYREGYLTGLTPGSIVTVTVGAGGAGGTGTGNGVAGGNTSFGSLIIANGGGGGFGASGGLQPTQGAAGAGGTGGVGTNGQPSGIAFEVSSGEYSAAFGGGAFGTPNNGPVFGGSIANSLPGLFPGGGATGALQGGTGAAGSGGLIILEW